MGDQEIRRLVWWNRFWAALLLIGATLWVGSAALNRARESTQRLSVYWREGGLALRSASDGPFLVTHLALIGTPTEAEKAVAQLPEPLAIIDSGGATISRDIYRKLVWRNFLGNPVPSPQEGAPVRALYTRPVYSRPSGRTPSQIGQ